MAEAVDELCPATHVVQPRAVIMSNLADTNPVFGRHMHNEVYAPREVDLDPIRLVKLPPATVYGGGQFITACNGFFIFEQVPPAVGAKLPSLIALAAVQRPAVVVAGEMLLVARFGLSTWGHWVGELLPKIVLVERAFPGRFSYVLPIHVINGAQSKSIWGSIAQCLTIYGIAPERICWLQDENNYVFTSLFAVTPVWSRHLMHPAASEALRQGAASIPPSPHPKLAVTRDTRFGRAIANREEVYALLAQHGFVAQTTGEMSVKEQIGAFKGAHTVFGVLGSDLTNLIFCPAGVDVITVAPDVFGDRFFYALTLDRSGRMADLRGSITDAHAVPHKGTFSIELSVLTAALAAMEETAQTPA